MKKIISLFVVAFMMLSISTAVFAADGIVVTAEDVTLNVNADDTTAVVNVTFEMPFEVGLLGFQPEIAFNKSALTLTGYALSGEGIEWSTSDSNTNAAYGAYLSFDDTSYTGTIPASEYVLTLTFKVNDVSVAKEEVVSLQALVGTTSDYLGLDEALGEVISLGEICKIIVKAEETVNTVDFAAVENNRAVVTSDAAATDWQIGTGVAITVNTEVAFTKMIWALTIDGVRKFSEPVVFEAPSTTGDVQFAATFINGGHNDNFDVNAEDPAEISNVDAIFTDGTAEYFTNADDAKPEYRG